MRGTAERTRDDDFQIDARIRGANRGRSSVTEPVIVLGTAGTLLAAVLVVSGHLPYLAYHSIVEALIAGISLTIFLVAWHTRHLVEDDFLTVLGIAQFFVAFVTVLHMLGLNGMSVFTSAEAKLGLGSQFWLILKGTQAAGFAAAALYIGRPLRRPFIAFAVAGIPIALLVFLVFERLFPATHITGSGLTPFKIYSEVAIVFTMFVGLVLVWRNRAALEVRVFRDVSLAILLLMFAELMFMSYVDPYDAISTLGHVVYLAGVYFLYDALVARALEDPYAVLFRRLAESERNYRTLYDSMDQGFLVADVLFDERGRVADLLCVQANRTVTEMVGGDLRGRRLSEVLPGDTGYWHGLWAELSQAGHSLRHERMSETTGRWYEFNAFLIGAADSHRIGAVFLDVTDRKRREESLGFLSDLAQLYGRTMTPAELMQSVGERLGEYLGAANVFYADIDEMMLRAVVRDLWGTGVIPDLTGVYRLSQFATPQLLERARQDRALIVPDTQAAHREDGPTYEAVNVASYVAVPFEKDGDWRYVLVVNDVKPREWREDEVDLIREVGERIFPLLDRARARVELTESEHRLRLALSAADMGAWDADLRTGKAVWNEEHYRLLGYQVDEVEPTVEAFLDRLHPDDRAAAAAARKHALQHGGDYSGEYRVLLPDGSIRWIQDHGSVRLDSDGTPERTYGVFQDVTERKLEEERRRLRMRYAETLNRINTAVHSSLDVDQIMATVVHGARDALDLDGALVQIRDGDEWHVRYANGIDASADPAAPLDPVIARTIASADGPVVLGDASGHDRIARAAAASGIVSLAGTRLIVRGDTVGVLILLSYSESRSFDEAEVEFVRRLGLSASTALQNARLYQIEHDIAETLQDTLVAMPHAVPGVAFSRAYESATYQSGRVGGDFVDIFETHGDWVGITLGDVSGKGLDAAVTTSLIRTALRVHAVDGLPPAEVASKANNVVRRFTEIESYATLWFGLLNTKTGLLRYICAGHPPPFVVSPEGDIRQLECKDPILGAFDSAQFLEWRTVMGARDRLVLYSDGVTEARSPGGEFLDASGLCDLIAAHVSDPTVALAQTFMSAVMDYSEGVLRDDAAILVVEATRLRPLDADDGQLRAFDSGKDTAEVTE